MDLTKLSDKDILQLVNNRWHSADDVWSIVNSVYKRNTIAYECEVDGKDRTPDYIRRLPYRRHRVRRNRIFVNVETVINSLISNPPVPQVIPGRETKQSTELAYLQEDFFMVKYTQRNIKEVKRKALRNLYFGRLAVIKPFWNPDINDFDAKSINPTKIRISPRANDESSAEFIIEEVTDSLESVLKKFPDKKTEILQKVGVAEDQVGIYNPDITYKEAHVKDYVCCVYNDLVLAKFRNPYWDWDGILLNDDEQLLLADPNTLPDQRKQVFSQARDDQESRRMQLNAEDAPQDSPNPVPLQAYYGNHFDFPRKPYIFATIFTDDDGPIGRTDMISQAIPLQESVDRRKQQIDDNARFANGILKVDSKTMSKAEAQKILFDPEGIVHGAGVKDGVTREYGNSLASMIYDDMQDSLQGIDDTMAASSAFRGEREGTETKAGRLALIQRSAARLEELTQVNDYLDNELFNWFYQLAKINYTEAHYAKTLGDGDAAKIIELQQDDFEDGTEIRVIAGQTLPEDQQFKYERAQADIAAGRISPIDYFRQAGYQNPVDLAKNAELFKINPVKASGVTDEELQQFAPPQQKTPEDPVKPPTFSVKYETLPPGVQTQVLALAGIQGDPQELTNHAAAQAAPQANDMVLANRQQDMSEMQGAHQMQLAQQQADQPVADGSV